MRIRHLVIGSAALTIGLLAARSDVDAQRGGGPPGAPRAARTSAPVDFTGTWVSVVSEDWRWRMVTPLKGDVASVPVNAAARKAAANWDLDRDNAANLQCKAFGVGGIMRQPGRVRISWQDDNTLKMEFDAGTQTRLLHFNRATPAPAEKTWQGHSIAEWQGPGLRAVEAPPGPGAGGDAVAVPGGGGRGLRGGPPPTSRGAVSLGASIKVVTTGQREGYLRKNGVPYSESAVITEHINRLPPTDGMDLLLVTTVVEDPVYLSQPFYTSSHFRKEADDSKWSANPCFTAPPLPTKVTKK
jgi:hypothetical protein